MRTPDVPVSMDSNAQTSQQSSLMPMPTSPRRRTLLKAGVQSGLAAAAGMALVGRANAASRTLKIGYVTALSGVRANFGEADIWNLDRIKKIVEKGFSANGKDYKIEIILKDNQSDMNRSMVIGNELINRDKVDLMLIQDADAANALGELCDVKGIPTISTMSPWQAWMFGRGSNPGKGFPYTFHFFWGADEIDRTFFSMWETVKTTKTVGSFFIDSPVGKAMADPVNGLVAGFGRNPSYKHTQGGFFKLQTDDFSNQISAFKNAKCDIVTGFMFDMHWTTFWNQAAQSNFKPEVCTVAAPFLFPSAINSLGPRGDGMSTEVWWTPAFPFKSSITGQSARALCEEWEASGGKQWTQPLGYGHALWEVGFAALKAAVDPKDPKSLRDAIANLAVDTIVGPVKFKGSPIKNVALTSMVGGQWRKAKAGSKFQYELLIVNNTSGKHIPVESDLKLLSMLR
jgi:branched-chain amino acid transport system substrate-binding protein